MATTNDFSDKLLEVIAAKLIQQGHMSDLPMPKGFGKLRWTGWKECQWDQYPHGQIVWYMERENGADRHMFYVDLPSMQHGRVKLGASFNIQSTDKSHLFSEFTDATEMREWFKEGFLLLMDDVLNECPWILEIPHKLV